MNGRRTCCPGRASATGSGTAHWSTRRSPTALVRPRGLPHGHHAERVAIREQVSRADQDAFALESHRRAVAAQKEGRFADEMAPVAVRDAKGRETAVDADESPRRDTTAEALARLRPAFPLPPAGDRGDAEEGTVTAGNAPGSPTVPRRPSSPRSERSRGWAGAARPDRGLRAG